MTAIFLKGLVSAVILVTADCWIAKGPAVVFARNERLPLVKCFQGALGRSRYICTVDRHHRQNGEGLEDWIDISASSCRDLGDSSGKARKLGSTLTRGSESDWQSCCDKDSSSLSKPRTYLSGTRLVELSPGRLMSNNNETRSSALPAQRPDNVPVLPAASNEFASQQPETADEREQRTVHDVYETIAPHFSRTRYKVR